MKGIVLSVVIGLVLATTFSAQATPLNLTQNYPDIMVASNAIAYNATTQQFTATGRPLTYSISDSATYNILNTTTTSYTLTATIDNAGQATVGTLNIGGTIASLGATSGTLLTGTLLAFGNGTGDAGDPFEFIFNVTGGDLASAFGSHAGVLIAAKSTNYAGFTADFSNGSGATNDTFSVPEPATLLLLVIGLGLHRSRRFAKA